MRITCPCRGQKCYYFRDFERNRKIQITKNISTSVFSQYSKQNRRCAPVNVKCFPEKIVGRSCQDRLSRVVRIKRYFLRKWTTMWHSILFSWCCKPYSVDSEGPVCFKNIFISTSMEIDSELNICVGIY